MPDFHRHAEEDDGVFLSDHEEDDDHPEGLAYALEELGPCFIKLGQLLSTRPDLLPADYIAALSRLQSTVDPMALAAASMAQVHRARLRNGDEVVVKVQRPGVRQRIETDIEVLHEVARFLTRYTSYGTRYGIPQMVRELEHSLNQELDFRQEAENTRIIGRQIAGFERLTTPSVYDEHTSRRALTLSFVRGRQLSKV